MDWTHRSVSLRPCSQALPAKEGENLVPVNYPVDSSVAKSNHKELVIRASTNLSYDMKKLLAKAAINCELDQYSRYLDIEMAHNWLNGKKFCDLLCAFS